MKKAANGNLPCKEIADILFPLYSPCEAFGTECATMRWSPKQGHIPRGFCGALGRPEQVELVLIMAEPGDPHPTESHSPNSTPEEFFATTSLYSYHCYETGKDLFHQNVRFILDLCWPHLTFKEQMSRTWITESVLCSARKEGGNVPSIVYRHCIHSYLEKQLRLFDGAIIAAVGSKARDRTKGVPKIIAVGAASPPGCNFRGVRDSWRKIANEVKKR